MASDNSHKKERYPNQALIQEFEDFENFEELKKALKELSEGCEIKRVLSDSCEIGSFYDLNQDITKSSKLDVKLDSISQCNIIEKLHISDPIFSTESDNSQQCCLYVTYEDYKECVDVKSISSQKTIKDSIYAHFVSSKVMGFQAVIELSSLEDTDGVDWIRIVDILLHKSDFVTQQKGSHSEELLFSVSGKVPLDFKFESEMLDAENFKYLQNLCHSDSYEAAIDRFLLRVEVMPLNLEIYFSPLLEKLSTLNEIKSSCSQQWIIDCIKREVLQKVIDASNLIKCGKDYLEINQFLQNLYQSFLLNRKKIKNVIIDLEQTVVKEIAVLQCFKSTNDEDSFKKDFDLIILYKSSLSLKKHQTLLNEMIGQYFEKNGKVKFYQKQLVNSFAQSVREDCEKCEAKIQEKDLLRKKWEKALNKNVKIECQASTSDSFANESEMVVKLCRNGFPMNPQLPVLDPPLNIRKLETSEHSITIEWTMPLEEEDHLVRCYRIDYRRVEENSSSRWHSIFTENQKTISIVDDLQSGSVYVFRVQAQFEDFVGVWSEESDRMSTETNSSISNEKFLNTDLKCELEEKNEEIMILKINVERLQEDKRKSDIPYSPGLKAMIGQHIDSQAAIGPIVALYEIGECPFQLGYDQIDKWKHFVRFTANRSWVQFPYSLSDYQQQTDTTVIRSRPILLPDKFHGVVVIVMLVRHQSNGDSFDVQLLAPQCEHNRKKALPLSLNLQMKIALLNGGYRLSNNHRFTIGNLGVIQAQSKNFVVPYKDSDSNNFPEIVLKFSIDLIK